MPRYDNNNFVCLGNCWKMFVVTTPAENIFVVTGPAERHGFKIVLSSNIFCRNRTCWKLFVVSGPAERFLSSSCRGRVSCTYLITSLLQWTLHIFHNFHGFRILLNVQVFRSNAFVHRRMTIQYTTEKIILDESILESEIIKQAALQVQCWWHLQVGCEALNRFD